MNRAKSSILRACSRFAGRAAALILGLMGVWTALAALPMWGQSAVWQPQGATSGNIYYNGGNVGIGTSSPLGGLHSATANQWSSWNYGASLVVDGTRNNALALLDYAHSNPWAIGSAAVGGSPGLQFSMMPPLGNVTNGASIVMTMSPNGNVGIGTHTPQYKLAVNGNIGAKDIIVSNSGWPDYVFQPGYRLRPLSEVHTYIQQHHHLPEVPSEAEVRAQGVRVGEMQAKLLAKVEELTLHLIQQDKNNRALREQASRQQRESEELRNRLARLEKGATADSARAAGK